jgi:hypothetical protein
MATYEVSETARDHYRIPGVSAERLRLALSLLEAAEVVRAEEAAGRRSQLLRAMLVADLDPVPAATVTQARRLAEHRERLIASGAHTVASLQRLRGNTSASTTRTWLARRRRSGALFTVSHDGSVLVPAFQFDEGGEPRPEMADVLAALAPLGLSGWALWTWFSSSSPWLDGARPVDWLDRRSEAVATAARRFASNAA